MSKYNKTRHVGIESSKTYCDKINNGFFDKYMQGSGLDIGSKGSDNAGSILEDCISIDLDYPGYDGKTLPFGDNSKDYIYNSHCLEHIADYKNAIRDWHRVIKPGGHIIIVVPHQYLYEKREFLPSNFNGDHKRLYTAASLLREIEESLIPNSFRIRHLQENDKGHDYKQLPTEHSIGQYEIEVVIQKLERCLWWDVNH